MEKEQIEQICKGFADRNFGDVMVVGGGISGIQASLGSCHCRFQGLPG